MKAVIPRIQGKLAFHFCLAGLDLVAQLSSDADSGFECIRRNGQQDLTALDDEIGSLFLPNQINFRRHPIELPLSMKPLHLACLLVGLYFPSVTGQEVVTKWDVEIPEPSTDVTPPEPTPKPEPIDFEVQRSLTKRVDVVESPEMPGLPPITGTINVTVQLVKDPGLPDPPPALPALAPEDPAVLARLAELREKHRGTELVFLSATVYNHNRTFLRIYPNGRAADSVTAWSNLDFKHFGGFSTYRVKDAEDKTLYDLGLLIGIGSTDTERWAELAAEKGYEYKAPVIPQLPDLSDGGPAFVVVEGDAKSPAMDTLEQIHDLYRKEGARMEEAYHARIKAYEERKAYLLANPPKPKDVTIQFWKRNNPSPRGLQALEGEAQP